MNCLTRFAPALCAVAILLVPEALRAGDDLPKAIVGPSLPAPDSQGSPDHDVVTFNICAPKSPAGFEASASFLLLMPSTGNLNYATTINPYPLATPHWNNEAVSPDFTPAFEIGLRYDFGCGADVRLDWTHLNSYDHAATAVPFPLPSMPGPPSTNGTPNMQALGPPFLLIGPPPPYASAAAVAHFEYDAINLDGGLSLCAGSHMQVRSFAGLQVAHISESLNTHFLSSDASISFTDVPQSVFTGIGPRLGMDVHCLCGNLDFLGEIAGSALLGTRQSRVDFSTSSPQTTAAGITPNFQTLTSADATQVIPAIDAKLGASYAIPVGKCGCLKCEAGYQAAAYIGAINQYSLSGVENSDTIHAEGTQSVFLRTAVELQNNFLVHGPYVKFTWHF
jgi:hypothetical protein